ncbi:uncharacterized protein BKCO1_500093 [Diplodia corticola]|uniref:Uncharacterized protein n=1 Tax=Diplodia corticola TaxID=236234 RepID=A0A1J9SC90_9PEZI|nr:uncharacterized protein BKCO1_500093 [Diplodia corticola]OJD38063.1 hypothetical protein BKCO1_500093 [Diplodia corticola]
MAEVVGIVAGAVQFLDVGSRVLISLSRFCSDLQNVPHKIKTVRQRLERTLQLVDSIKSDVEAPNTGPGTTLSGIISQPQVDFAKGLLEDAAAQVTELQVLLTRLAFTGDSLAKKAWRAVVAIKKEEEILSKWNDIETTTGLLQIWMQHQSLKLIRDDILVDKDHAGKISGVEKTLVTSQQSLDKMPQAIENIVQASQSEIVREIGTNSYRLGERTRQMEQNFDVAKHDVLRGITTVETSMHGSLQSVKGDIIDQIMRDRTSQSADNQALRSQFASLQQTMNQILIQHTSQRLISKPSYFEDIEVSASYASRRLTKSRVPTRPGRGTLCTCTTWMTRSYKSWKSFQFCYDPTLVHETNCPLHHRSNRSWTLGVRAILPALCAYCIDMALQIDFGAGGFAISPSMRMAARVVDCYKSPLFRAIFHLYMTIALPEIDHTRALETFKTRLRFQLSKGHASAYDQDTAGRTALDTCLHTIWKPIRVLGNVHQNELVISIIDAFLEGFARPDSIKFQTPKVAAFSRILSRHGCSLELSDAYRFEKSELKHIWRNADLCDEFNLPWRYAAAVQKSLPLLGKSIENQTFEQRHGHLPSVLTFALHWPEGRRLLIAAGANPLDSIPFALELGDMEALKDLIHQDLHFFSGQESSANENLLREWYYQPYYALESARQTSLDIIVNHLVQLRGRLLNLARKHLQPQEQKRLGIHASNRQEDILDGVLLQAYRMLNLTGVRTPSFLYPGCQSSVYHWYWVVNLNIAKRLFLAGFHRLDIKDDNGVRPIELACANGDLDLVAWFLQHGAAAPEQLIWSIAASQFYHGLNAAASVEIISACGYPESDTCRCYCSSKGCLPSTVLLKRKERSWDDKKGTLEEWIRNIPPGFRFQSYREACRLEIFERLGMSHTCCSLIHVHGALVRHEMEMDDQLEISEEERDFSIILNQYMHLFDRLSDSSTSPFTVFWDLWWTAVDMTLPDLYGRNTFLGRYRCRLSETASDLEYIQSYGPHERQIRLVVDQYSNIVGSIARFVPLFEPWGLIRSWDLCHRLVPWGFYFGTVEVDRILCLPKDIDMQSPWEEVLPYASDFDIPRIFYLDPPERIKKVRTYIMDKVIPAMAQFIILDLYFGQSIPEDIRQHLEAEGLLQDGELVHPATKEADPETIFQDCINTLFEP